MKPYVSIDIETTGLNPETCQVLEFGAVIEDWDGGVNALPRFHCYILNDGPIVGDPFALSMHSLILGRIAKRDPHYTYLTPPQAAQEFWYWLNAHSVVHDDGKEFQVAGKNFDYFDRQFLKKLPGWSHIPMHRRAIDPGSMYWRPGKMVPSTAECKEKAGVLGDVAHTAVADALDVIRLIRRNFNIPLEVGVGSDSPYRGEALR